MKSGYVDMFHDKRSALSGYVSGLLSTGRTAFTAQEAEQALGVGHGAFLDAAERLQRRKALVSPRQGFYVVVPPQYASWGRHPRPGISTRSCAARVTRTTSVSSWPRNTTERRITR